MGRNNATAFITCGKKDANAFARDDIRNWFYILLPTCQRTTPLHLAEGDTPPYFSHVALTFPKLFLCINKMDHRPTKRVSTRLLCIFWLPK